MHRLVLLFMILATAKLVFAQTERANLTGTITDPAGRVVRDAAITLHAVATGIDSVAQTNSAGDYNFSALPVGEYTLSIRAEGFAKEVVNSLTLQVGETRTLNISLHLSTVNSEVEVVADTPNLNMTSAEVSGVIQRSQLKDLPVNGRYWASMEVLLPGAISSGTGTQDTIRFSGLSQEDNNFRLDGVDATGLNHQFVKTPMRAEFPMESLAEFKGSSSAYSADVGSMAGGQISMVTRSGSNQFHGSFYEYLRNSDFDAADWNAGAVSPFHMNQFGASVGGPIRRKKMFFFANYEGVQQAYQSQLTATIPSPAFQSQVLAKSPVLSFVLNAYPQGGSPTSDPDGYYWSKFTSSPTTENAGLARFDCVLSDKTNITVRFNDDDYLNTSSALAEDTVTYTKTPNAMIEVQHTFSPKFLNVSQVAYNRDDYQDVGANTKIPYTVSISGLTGLALGDHSDRVDNSFSFLDNATWYRGRHTLKTGTEVRHMQEHNQHPWLEQSLSYTSEKNFINDALDSYTNQPGQNANMPRKTPIIAYVMDGYKLRPNLTLNAGLQYEFYSSGINKAPGAVVFDPFTCPWQPAQGGPYCPAGSAGYNANWLDFMPRVSAMWAPELLHGKTAVRAGFGMYYDDSQPNGGPPGLLTAGKFSLSSSNIPNLTYPVTPFLGQAAATAISISGKDRNMKDVKVNEWTFSIQQELARQTTLTVGYLGTKGTHLLSGTTLNGIDPTTNARPYASITTSTIGYTQRQGNLTLEALQVGLQRNLSTGLLISSNYQYAHEISDGSTGDAENDTYQNVLCRQCERGAADYDMRHNLTMSTIWDVPVGKGHSMLGSASPVMNRVVGGWQMSGIAQARTGFPVNITTSRSSSCSYAPGATCVSPYGINSSLRPNLAPGKSVHDIYTSGTGLNGARLRYDPTALAMPANNTWGNLPRNAVRAPGLWQIDGSMQKRFPIHESMGVSFRADIFNLFNAAQLGSPSKSWTAPTGTTFGQITSAFTTNPVGTGTARQMQFSLRFEY